MSLFNQLAGNAFRVAVVVALLTFIGVFLKAIFDLFGTSRTKYVDVIAAQRILWVSVLREDFRKLLIALDNQHFSFHPTTTANQAVLNEAVNKVNDLIAIVCLKLNHEDEQDDRIINCLSHTIYVSRTGNSRQYWEHRAMLMILFAFRLKDEWEKAKREASGPLRWLYLINKRRRSRKSRKKLIERDGLTNLWEKTSKPMDDVMVQTIHNQAFRDPNSNLVRVPAGGSDEAGS